MELVGTVKVSKHQVPARLAAALCQGARENHVYAESQRQTEFMDTFAGKPACHGMQFSPVLADGVVRCHTASVALGPWDFIAIVNMR